MDCALANIRFAPLDELYSNGVHDQISKSNAELVSAVNAQIKKRGQQGVSRDTILRAAGRCKYAGSAMR